ncbi:MAG: RluA family pseudouridine synthase [Alphaproteobacteria bacterium]
MTKAYKVYITPELNRERLDKALATLLPIFSRSRLQALIMSGHVRVEGHVIEDPKTKVKEGQFIQIDEPEAEETPLEAEDIPLDIIFEDDHLLVINKPAGLVVHPGAGNKKGTLVNALLGHSEGHLSVVGGVKRPGIVHRLDKDTSGLMVVAKTDAAHQKLSAQFSDRTLSRTYLAFVVGQIMPEGTIDQNIGRSSHNRQKMAVRRVGGKEAITHYKVLEYYGEHAVIASLVECRLETGRTHQIRVHLANAGHPLIGDPVYGRAKSNPMLKRLWAENPGVWIDDRQALHAAAIKFTHPATGEKMKFEIPFPPDLEALQNILEGA